MRSWLTELKKKIDTVSPILWLVTYLLSYAQIPIVIIILGFQSPRQSAQYLYWYHNNQMVNYGKLSKFK